MRTEWDAIQRIHPVSRETFDRLTFYIDRLQVWQKKTNLIAPSTLEDIWHRHICDSLQCVALKPSARTWVDIGSGGGFPGLVIAACMAEVAGSKVTLIESNQKKCAFLRQVARQMGGDTSVICDRIERASPEVEMPEIVTARALAELPHLLELAEPWLSAELDRPATALFHKGRDYRQELANSDGTWRYDLVVHESNISADSVLLEISNLRRKSN